MGGKKLDSVNPARFLGGAGAAACKSVSDNNPGTIWFRGGPILDQAEAEISWWGSGSY